MPPHSLSHIARTLADAGRAVKKKAASRVVGQSAHRRRGAKDSGNRQKKEGRKWWLR